MAVIKRVFLENEQKVAELNPSSIMVIDILNNAVEIANKKDDDIEYRLDLNGVNLRFRKGITFYKLHKDFQNQLKKRQLL